MCVHCDSLDLCELNCFSDIGDLSKDKREQVLHKIKNDEKTTIILISLRELVALLVNLFDVWDGRLWQSWSEPYCMLEGHSA